MKTHRNLFRLFGFLVMILLATTVANGQNRKALVIGIDEYKPAAKQPEAVAAIANRGWGNLDGCVNDALAMKEIIVTRYGFKEQGIVFLQNQEASRERILKEMQNLIDNAKSGDIIFIYYAGHGSQVPNTASKEADKRDESMVPADSYKGAADIRDKELAALFNKLIDKGVKLTVIFDSCHSGSVSRGNLTGKEVKTRFMMPSPDPVSDATEPENPAKRGALIISSAQDYEFAKEDRDDNGKPHGAFTLAFIRATQALPPNATASQIFESTQAIMKAHGKTQVPVMEGTSERKSRSLIGLEPSELSGKVVVPVISINNSAKTVELQGGNVIGLRAGSELVQVNGGTSPVKVKVKELTGLNKSGAEIIAGEAKNIKEGELFEIVKWGVSTEPALKVYIPSSSYSAAQLAALAKDVESGISGSLTKINDPANSKAPVIVYYNGKNWNVSNGETVADLGAKPDGKSVMQHSGSGNEVFVNLPADKELFEVLKAGFGNVYTAIAIVDDPLLADYYLVGRYNNGKIEYSWMLPNIQDKKENVVALPLRTNWFAGDAKTVGDSLMMYSLKLGKVKSWLTLQAPPDDGSFPYDIAIKDLGSQEWVSDGKLKDGKTYRMYLVTDDNRLAEWDRQKRYVYILHIDLSGKTTLIYPRSGSSVENYHPIMIGSEYPEQIRVGGNFTIKPPLGTDNFIMLTTNEALPNPMLLESAGVVTRGERAKGTDGDLMKMLLDVGAKTRAISTEAPSNWALQRLTLKSIP